MSRWISWLLRLLNCSQLHVLPLCAACTLYPFSYLRLIKYYMNSTQMPRRRYSRMEVFTVRSTRVIEAPKQVSHGQTGARPWQQVNPRPVRGVDATPHAFFWAGRHTVWRIALKFSIAYGASFAQILVKKMVWSGQVTKLWSHKRNNLRQDFSEIVIKRKFAWCDWLEWG